MLHVRKTLTKKEKEEYKEWLKKHKPKKISKSQQEKINQKYWDDKNKRIDPRVREVTISSIPFLQRVAALNPIVALPKLRYEDEILAKREELAQLEIAEKRKCVAPHYNKGPVQYVTPGIDLHTLGKKV